MFVITTKLSKTRIAAVAVLLIAAIVLAAVAAAARSADPEEDPLEGGTNDARLAYLTRCGWELNGEPIQTQTVKIPAEESEVFTRYNELQKSQGFDLSQYAGQQATRYVYEVLNYPDADGPVYATLFVLRGRIIGGDVTDSGPQGKIRGLEK